ncbi:hypothetical protein [Levilactobacillus bambusae]|uniref:Uncharacterized protein n=1 Tax=Levilactobacillus bambusae TaxID=2024736 RepID=A0A2V1MZA2_9LACO|nr:hypothetical protein [Levilactobacillus bambusae]PWG00299.1 hypothetical protein DCM90_05045 [Levilactobacillus bambusae]
MRYRGWVAAAIVIFGGFGLLEFHDQRQNQSRHEAIAVSQTRVSQHSKSESSSNQVKTYQADNDHITGRSQAIKAVKDTLHIKQRVIIANNGDGTDQAGDQYYEVEAVKRNSDGRLIQTNLYWVYQNGQIIPR